MYFKRYPFIQKLIPTGFPKRQRAMYGFRALGLEARPAIPAIVSLVLNSSENGHAIGALTGAQEEDIVLIAQALSNPDREVRVRAAFALG